jgi:uncharacterized protein (TIGR02996 family)
MTETAQHLLAQVRAGWADRTQKLVLADALDEADMHRQAALWRVIAEPWKDEHRLAFADVCEREGDLERAEFVRLQLELTRPVECAAPAFTGKGIVNCEEWNARHPSRNNWCEPCGRRRDHRRREDLLLEEHAWPHWCRQHLSDFEIVPFGHRFQNNIHYRRGFVESLTCTWLGWKKQGRVLREKEPIESIALTTMPQIWAAPPDNDSVSVSDELDDVHVTPVEEPEHILMYLSYTWPCIKFTLPERHQGSGVAMHLTIGQSAR